MIGALHYSLVQQEEVSGSHRKSPLLCHHIVPKESLRRKCPFTCSIHSKHMRCALRALSYTFLPSILPVVPFHIFHSFRFLSSLLHVVGVTTTPSMLTCRKRKPKERAIVSILLPLASFPSTVLVSTLRQSPSLKRMS